MEDGLARLRGLMDKGLADMRSARKEKRTARELDEFAGTYQSKAFGELKVRREESGLSVRLGDKRARLENWHYDIFMLELDLDYVKLPMLVSFKTGLDGKISALELQADTPLTFLRK
jgi:hypothetical protein